MAQAAAVVLETPHHVTQRARPREAAAEADRAEAPAAAEPEVRIVAVRIELLLAEQRRRDVGREQPLEGRGRILLAPVAGDGASDDLVGQARRGLDRRELLAEVRLERAGERAHERVEVLALLGSQRPPDRSVAERLPDAEPVA